MKARKIIARALAAGAVIAGSLVVANPAQADSGYFGFVWDITNTVKARVWIGPGDLNRGTLVHSPNNKISLYFQGDGNLVVYRESDQKALWAASWTNPQVMWAGYDLALQSDKNLVIYSANHNPLWASNTVRRCPDDPALAVQDDGNVVLYCMHYDNVNDNTPEWRPYWATNTRA